MLGEFESKLAECQTIVLKGFKSTHESDLMWLNELCSMFLSLFNYLHKYLVFDSNENPDILETCFLCTTQVTTCVKHLEFTLKTETLENTVLTATRQFFLDRIIFCLARLRDTVAGNCPPMIDQNFPNFIDNAIEMVTEFTEIESCSSTNQCELLAEMMIKSKNIKQIIESLLSQALAFMQVTLNDDKKAIHALCQKVLEGAIGLEQACSLADTCKSVDLKDRQLKAQLLETALFQLENVVNESVLRLLFQIFMDLSENPLRRIRELHSKSPNDPAIDELTADFDSITDRFVHVGVFALTFADNRKIASSIRSCLASLEALESELIPSILSYNCETHSKILEQHWNEEIELLEAQITNIIDSRAFCKSLLDIIEQCIRTNATSFDRRSIVAVVNKSKILFRHFEMNEDLLNLRLDGAVKFYFEDFNLILKECEAAVDYIGKIDQARILKRIKILKSTLKKMEKALSQDSTKKSDKEPVENIISISEDGNVTNDLKNSDKFFTSHNIRASTRSILYRTNEFCTIKSKIAETNREFGRPKTATNAGRIRTSLRVAMFKRTGEQLCKEKNTDQQHFKNDTMGLNITDILEQLTDLSTTLSEKCVVDPTIVEEDCKIIIKIKNP